MTALLTTDAVPVPASPEPERGGRSLSSTVGVLVPALSQGRRRKARLVSGSAAAFATDLNIVYVPSALPFAPLLAALSVGIALQGSPTKNAVAALDLDRVNGRLRAALSRVEGAAALGWLRATWPGLAADAERLAPGIAPIDPSVGAEELLAEARAWLGGKGDLTVPPIFGLLPGPAPFLAKAPWLPQLRPRSRKPKKHSMLHLDRFDNDSHSVSGPTGDEVGHFETPDPDEEQTSADRRIGIPYPEWDTHQQRYHRNHVTVLETRVPPAVGAPLPADPAIAAWFRRSPTRTWHNRLEDGSDIDIAAFIEASCRQATGEETDGRLYSALLPGARDAATAILLDGSSSLSAAGGVAFELELACADALTGAMSLTGERFAVFTFTGASRHRVEVRLLRDFADGPGPMARPGALRASGYTRLGAALRHVTARLLATPAERRILLSIGDGVPYDMGYSGLYAKGDVAQAVAEATGEGVLLHHIGVGDVRRDPLPECFGPGRFRRIVGIDDLPAALADVHEALVAQ